MHVADMCILGVGVALVVFSVLGMALLRDDFTRLHFLTPASTLGLPIVCLAVILDQGATRISLKVAVIAVLCLVSQPAVTAATGRALARHRGVNDEDAS